MNYNDAFALANADGSFIEGFIKCTYVELYDKHGRYLYTIKASYTDWPDIAFRKTDKKFDTRSMGVIPFCRAYDHVARKGKAWRVPVMLSEELRYVMQQLILRAPQAKDPYKLVREWLNDCKYNGERHQKGELQYLTQAYEAPEMKGHENGQWTTKRGKTVLIVKVGNFYEEYWEYPQYEYAFEDRYLKILKIIEQNEPVYVLNTAVDWWPDGQIVTTIEDNILLVDGDTDPYSDSNQEMLVDEETGEPIKLYDDEGNEVETDEHGKPIFPDASEITVGSEALEQAKKELDNAKTILYAAGATMLL